jgi:hypothetical protein
MKACFFLVIGFFISVVCYSQKPDSNLKKDTAREIILVLNEEQAHDLSILLQVGKAYMPETDIRMKSGIRIMNFGDSLAKAVNSKLALWRPKNNMERPKSDSLQLKTP